MARWSRRIDLAGVVLGHPAPGMRIVTIPEPGLEVATHNRRRACSRLPGPTCRRSFGIDGTERVWPPFDGELADRHPPTGPSQAESGSILRGHEGVRLLTWGRPLPSGLATGGARRALDGCGLPICWPGVGPEPAFAANRVNRDGQ